MTLPDPAAERAGEPIRVGRPPSARRRGNRPRHVGYRTRDRRSSTVHSGVSRGGDPGDRAGQTPHVHGRTAAATIPHRRCHGKPAHRSAAVDQRTNSRGIRTPRRRGERAVRPAGCHPRPASPQERGHRHDGEQSRVAIRSQAPVLTSRHQRLPGQSQRQRQRSRRPAWPQSRRATSRRERQASTHPTPTGDLRTRLRRVHLIGDPPTHVDRGQLRAQTRARSLGAPAETVHGSPRTQRREYPGHRPTRRVAR